LPFVDIEVHVQWFKIYFAFVDIPAHVQLMAEVHVAPIHKLWQCTCGAWNLEEQATCPWKGNCKKKKQIPIAEYGDGALSEAAASDNGTTKSSHIYIYIYYIYIYIYMHMLIAIFSPHHN